MDGALAAAEGMAVQGRHREVDETEYELVVFRAPNRKRMGEPREPGRPDRSMFT